MPRSENWPSPTILREAYADRAVISCTRMQTKCTRLARFPVLYIPNTNDLIAGFTVLKAKAGREAISSRTGAAIARSRRCRVKFGISNGAASRKFVD